MGFFVVFGHLDIPLDNTVKEGHLWHFRIGKLSDGPSSVPNMRFCLHLLHLPVFQKFWFTVRFSGLAIFKEPWLNYVLEA